MNEERQGKNHQEKSRSEQCLTLLFEFLLDERVRKD
jgi:hypothetical protein